MTARWWINPGGQLSKLKTSRHARPVVVIDPEDAEQVERLARLIRDAPPHLDGTPVVAAALREFAAPTPPKPDEPQGLGAVVEDASGGHWVRWTLRVPPDVSPWRSAHAVPDHRQWSHIDAVRVLSEGVTP